MIASSLFGLELSNNKLGPLILGPELLISKEKLALHFPEYDVVHDIRSGDSPDFHFLGVYKLDELIFYIVSYIDTEEAVAEYPMHLLVVVSPTITDKYGLRVGDSYRDVVLKRSDELIFGAGHHTNNLGANSIYYEFSLEPSGFDQAIEMPDMSPENATIGDLVEQNPKIESISWPYPSWD
jgi:hypothetical protein